jgi:sarcosine oxidase / L-pipecolate oxidase
MASSSPVPSSILIIGAGAFGLSTTLSLLHNSRYSSTHITILDASPCLPNPSGSSVDANRIVRADYADTHYATLAAQAQLLWRQTTLPSHWGAENRYHEPGFVLTADADRAKYLKVFMGIVQNLANEGKEWSPDAGKIKELMGEEEIGRVTGYEGASMGVGGYANFNSGWADAMACVEYALRRVREEGGDRVTIRAGTRVERLLVKDGKCLGAVLDGGGEVVAELTILAAGAWSPTLIDLQGRCLATGQSMAYIDITDEEQKSMATRPTIMNWSRGMFIIPPRKRSLKIARHGYGYRNPVRMSRSDIQPGSEVEGEVEVSVPVIGEDIPLEAKEALREALSEMAPSLKDRPWTRTRICWYCDT